MANWYLSFQPPKDIDACARVLTELVGPVTTTGDELEGNPYDSYYGNLYLSAQRDDLTVVAILTLSASTATSTPTASGLSVRIDCPSFATKLAAWHTLGEALAKIGCSEYTLIGSGMADIVDEAEAVDAAYAAQLRAQITAALVAHAPQCAAVLLTSTRPDDIEAILAAYPTPERISSVILSDLKLTALPTNLARFYNTEHLTLTDLDGSALRGLQLLRLTALHLRDSKVRQLQRDDVAGFPALTELFLQDSALEVLDPAIRDVCPQLRRVNVQHTRVRPLPWPGVTWE